MNTNDWWYSIPLEDRYKMLAQEYIDNSVCNECGSPLIVTVSKYPYNLEFGCTNPSCIYVKLCGSRCNASIAKYKGICNDTINSKENSIV